MTVRVYPHMDGDRLIELVEKSEYDALKDQLQKVRIRCSEWAEIAGKHGALVDKLERELNAVKGAP